MIGVLDLNPWTFLVCVCLEFLGFVAVFVWSAVHAYGPRDVLWSHALACLLDL